MRLVGWSRLPVPPKLSVPPVVRRLAPREVGSFRSALAEGLVRPDLAVTPGEVWITVQSY
jgi:hypothetical protein